MNKSENLGLGLIICYELAKFLAPQKSKEPFKIESEPGLGTKISIELCTLNLGSTKYEQPPLSSLYSGSQMKIDSDNQKSSNLSMIKKDASPVLIPVNIKKREFIR